MTASAKELLIGAGIQPSAQRLAVADYVLFTEDHPSADEVHRRVLSALPMVSRATVYNTLNVLVERGLLRQLVLAEGHVVFDPKLTGHHHFIDDRTGKIFDLPLTSVSLGEMDLPEGYSARDVQVVIRGRRDA